ncbi:MAG: hypothetical protein JWO30_615 [Fibrobacteres bacterium]|nr:hypothetical protein [Fibrobacterota bacterium]
MINNKLNVLALGAMTALIFAACDNSTGPAAPDQATIKADLQVMAAKITRMSVPSTKGAMGPGGDGGFEKKAAIKASPLACMQEGMTVETGLDTSATGVVGTFEDTTYSYTAANVLICADMDATAYQIGHDHSKDAVMESWMTTKMVFSGDFLTNFAFAMTGTGKVHYTSGYDLTIDAISLKGSFAGLTEFKMTLGLDAGKYTAPLTVAAGVDLMSDVDPAPTTVIFSGPILSGGTTVGYFEILGNDSVVIRDAAKVIVAVHG